MAYSGAEKAAECRKNLGSALEALQQTPDLPDDVLSVTQHIAEAVSALFEAEKATSEPDGKGSVRHAMGSLSQTMALLQDVRSEHQGIGVATKALAQVMSELFPLSNAPSQRPSAPPGFEDASAPQAPAAPTPASEPPRERQHMEANVGATTQSNFFVGFSGEISEGGIFIATYNVLPKGTSADVLITLPGGYETRVKGTVRFVRDPMDFSMDTEPGMGVQFDSLDPQSRELILRFVRKRPPMFFDD